MLRVEDPIHGAVVNHRWGTQSDQGLRLTVTGTAPPHGAVVVNGQPAQVINGRFAAEVLVTQPEQDIVATYSGTAGEQRHAIRIVWDQHSRPRYRFSIDDNSFWLRDVHQQQHASIFDCFYLDILRGLHREYGTKFTLNIYSQTDDDPANPFYLVDFSDRYRGEFADNAGWLVLAFHAKSNLPDRPYQYASAETLLSDKHFVEEQIVRIAGEATLAQPTVIHWGMVPPEAWKAMYDDGIRVLSGFSHSISYGYDVNYWLDQERSEWLYHHEAIKDFPSGLLFSASDIVCNNTPVEEIGPTLQPLYDDPRRAEIMDLFTHEQYFWPFYARHIPDHGERLNQTIRWVAERGYEPIFYHEGFMGI